MENKNRYKFIDEKKQHLHTINEMPAMGISSIVSIISKPLTWWAAELSAVECLETGEKIPSIREEYLKASASENKKKAIDELQKKYPIFKKARFAHFSDRNTKADKGTDLHAELETLVKDIMAGKIPEIKNPKVAAFAEWAKANIKRFLWSELYCWSANLWCGGISDAGIELNSGEIAIIDFKSSKEAYFNQFIQIAGYDLLISENGGYDKEGNKIFELEKPITKYIVFPFGAEKPSPSVFTEVVGARKAFEGTLTLYKFIEHYK